MTITDIHSHILPDIDDGSHSMEESEVMLGLMYGQGVRRLFCTPHSYALDRGLLDDRRFRSRAKEVRARFEALKARAEELFPQMELYLAYVLDGHAGQVFSEELE